MRKMIQAAVAVAVVVVGSSTASAVLIGSMVHYIDNGCHRNAVWPWPYVCPDRMAAREPFALMTSNGWRRQNLLGNHHFQRDTNELTTAGELKVRWIVTQAPPSRRQIFIERSLNPDVTAQRIAVAKAYADQVAFEGHSAEVYDTHLASEGRPAPTVDATNVRFQESMPPPVLPAATSAFGN